MKYKLVCNETHSVHIPESEFRFENMYGQDCGSAVKIPARDVTTYKGEKFTASNKRELQTALASGKWQLV